MPSKLPPTPHSNTLNSPENRSNTNLRPVITANETTELSVDVSITDAAIQTQAAEKNSNLLEHRIGGILSVMPEELFIETSTYWTGKELVAVGAGIMHLTQKLPHSGKTVPLTTISTHKNFNTLKYEHRKVWKNQTSTVRRANINEFIAKYDLTKKDITRLIDIVCSPDNTSITEDEKHHILREYVDRASDDILINNIEQRITKPHNYWLYILTKRQLTLPLFNAISDIFPDNYSASDFLNLIKLCPDNRLACYMCEKEYNRLVDTDAPNHNIIQLIQKCDPGEFKNNLILRQFNRLLDIGTSTIYVIRLIQECDPGEFKNNLILRQFNRLLDIGDHHKHFNQLVEVCDPGKFKNNLILQLENRLAENNIYYPYLKRSTTTT